MNFSKATDQDKRSSAVELPSIILQNQVPRGMKKSKALMRMEAKIKKYTFDRRIFTMPTRSSRPGKMRINYPGENLLV
uniref:Uncharacterized protein n=1 Tax=Timema monikensis TaxID=170555 RepID=A0A7R9E603_9NEOP|nr:unnamed protein product [Timema monikensis]